MLRVNVYLWFYRSWIWAIMCEVFSHPESSVPQLSHVEPVSTAIDPFFMDDAPSPMTYTPCKVKSIALKPNVSTVQEMRPKPVITCMAPPATTERLGSQI